ncbi:protein kinase family protein / peptidoglycan-binding LysM domain-containing protein [Artemisia annua]|uniref:Protein kinase family protein / peptidoglycan-binding LysM domain-containing protein n=1 Tax=Artemisia annua TaxID=35608 RepID=A0A2U1PU17_ARTAN|nr:protein kinase family protein / peptidoglycan-binding LysM domain-containing protein [Artemisia annua]
MSLPGEPYPVDSISPPAPAPVVSSGANVTVEESDHKSGVKHWWIIGGLGGGLAVILAVVAVFVCVRSALCYGDGRPGLKDHEDGHKFHILRTSSSWCGSGRLCCKSDDWRRTNTIEESSDLIAIDVFDVEKPVVFAYEEVLSCTDFFSESNLLVHGTYVSVYYGLLREQDVAVKRMTAMKTKEFIAEMKVLCKRVTMNSSSYMNMLRKVHLGVTYMILKARMLAALKHSPDSMSMSGLKDHIDPNLLDLFPHDSVFKMATLAKHCVDEDPILRPDMKQIAFHISFYQLVSGKLLSPGTAKCSAALFKVDSFPGHSSGFCHPFSTISVHNAMKRIYS